LLTNGMLQFTFTSSPAATFTVLTSTNLALPLSNWTVLGAPVSNGPSSFQFRIPATNGIPQFFGVRSP
jgi:hypothetical protein